MYTYKQIIIISEHTNRNSERNGSRNNDNGQCIEDDFELVKDVNSSCDELCICVTGKIEVYKTQ